MYRIVRREQLGPVTFLWEVAAPKVARAARPGHFLMVRIDETGERIPLTVADFDPDAGTVTVVIQAVGSSTRRMMALPEGATILDFVGPLGVPSAIGRPGKVVLVGGGLGVAPIFPQLRAYKANGNATIAILGFRSRDQIFWIDKLGRYSDELHVATDDGSYGVKGRVTEVLERVLDAHPEVAETVAIGPLVMMQACAEVTRPRGIRTLVSLNSIMVDGTGMCGSCRVTVGGEMRFACVDGPDFDGHQVDFKELMLRQRRFARDEREALERQDESLEAGAPPPRPPAGRGAYATSVAVPVPEPLPPPPPGEKPPAKTVRTIAPTRTPMPAQPAEVRARNFDEVNLGYTAEQAFAEAERCMICKKPRCVPGCPVGIDIPAFVAAVARHDLPGAYRILKSANALPAICGRVCPQETQCELGCIVGHTLEPVSVGRLERFVADFAADRGWEMAVDVPPTGKRVAIVGSGPAGLACAGDLVKAGVEVTVFEALHVAGGVLKYGIPEFRLPSFVIDREIETLRRMGVRFELDAVIGKLHTVPQLLGELGFDAVFVGTGAGSPKFLNIPGESLNGVLSANELLTRVNLMHGNEKPWYDTPVGVGRRVAVVGAGNTAMDAVRVALRMGADEVSIVYRRSRQESPARAEELHHAMEEGVRFHWLTNPVRILGNRDGWVAGMECIEMELGEPDASGRRSPIPKPGTEKVLDVDTVVPALGTAANPVISQTTPGLDVSRGGYIVTDPRTMATSMPGVFAGGDIVTGSATVILAMGAGRRAAAGILAYLGLAAPGSPFASSTAPPASHRRPAAESLPQP